MTTSLLTQCIQFDPYTCPEDFSSGDSFDAEAVSLPPQLPPPLPFTTSYNIFARKSIPCISFIPHSTTSSIHAPVHTDFHLSFPPCILLPVIAKGMGLIVKQVPIAVAAADIMCVIIIEEYLHVTRGDDVYCFTDCRLYLFLCIGSMLRTLCMHAYLLPCICYYMHVLVQNRICLRKPMYAQNNIVRVSVCFSCTHI